MRYRIPILLTALAAIAGTLWCASQQRRPAAFANSDEQYADPASCAQCHVAEAAAYAKTGMARAFHLATADDLRLSDGAGYDHAVSNSHFRMNVRDGKLYQSRSVTGYEGREEDAEELSVDAVMGSGNHVKTFLHRDTDGSLIELPMAWYAEQGGHWALNPGFDNPQPPARRLITYECMFCHNAYPQIPAVAHRDLVNDAVYSGTLPQGIDCQRCHGPGAAHVAAARKPGTPQEQIEALILNPAKLPKPRQMQLCEQCHLETTSGSLPDRLRRYDRGPFEYNPTEPLGKFNIYFERDAKAGGRIDQFEIVNSVYRLRQSQCYLKSGGELTCETCHNPHNLKKGPAAAAYYEAKCLSCHGKTLPDLVARNQHPAGHDCVSCHMPTRRTEDVIHAVMTDHLIQRIAAPEAQRLAERREQTQNDPVWHGQVKHYLLDGEAEHLGDAVYEVAAQVVDGTNAEQGIPQLQALLAKSSPKQPTPYIQLGDAQRDAGKLRDAIASYRSALAIDPRSIRALRRLATTLADVGQPKEAVHALDLALQDEPRNALLLSERGRIQVMAGNAVAAKNDLESTIALKPGSPEAHGSLAALLAQQGDATGAERELRESLKRNPYDAATRANLARILRQRNDLAQAEFQFSRSLALDPSQTAVRIEYAQLLMQTNRNEEAGNQLKEALRLDEHSSTAHWLLGELLGNQGDLPAAKREFESAIQLDANNAGALLDLGMLLVDEGSCAQGRELLQRAAKSSNARAAQNAQRALAASACSAN